MSERKSAEVKFRCTPTFKSGLQAAASAAGQSLTEYVESAVWAHQNAQLDGASLVDNAIESLREVGAGESAAVALLEEAKPRHTWIHPALQPADAPDEDRAACSCRPWEYCTHKAGA